MPLSLFGVFFWCAKIILGPKLLFYTHYTTGVLQVTGVRDLPYRLGAINRNYVQFSKIFFSERGNSIEDLTGSLN